MNTLNLNGKKLVYLPGYEQWNGIPNSKELHDILGAVSCNPNGYYLAGTGLGLGLTGKPGCAWVGAWAGAWVHGCGGV